MNIALLGLGLMGRAAAERLQARGHPLIAWNRSPEAVEAALEAGLNASTDLTLAADADCLLLMLSDAAAIGQTLDTPYLASLNGKTLIQMGTVAPDESRALAARTEAAGGCYLEAPVLGSLPEARSGTLIIMAGGEPEVFTRCLPVLRTLGAEPRLIGPVGKGAALKLAMNQLIAGLTASFSASLGLIRAEEIDPEVFMALLRVSALYAPTFDKKLERMLGHEYANPNFPLKHLIKDSRLFIDAASSCGVDTRSLEALTEVFEEGAAAGYADADYSALYEAINRPRR